MTDKILFQNEDIELRREQYLEKPLPSSPHSERLIIGECFMEHKLIGDCFAKGLMPIHFYNPLLKSVYEILVDFYFASPRKEISPVTVSDKLKQSGKFYEPSVLLEFTRGLVVYDSLEEYILILQRKTVIRDRIKAHNQATSILLSEDDDDELLLAEADAVIKKNLETKHVHRMDHVSDGNSAADEFDRKLDKLKQGKPTGINLPYPDVQDYVPTGLTLGELSGIGARPSDGKTLQMCDESKFIAKHLKKKILIVTTEVGKGEIFQKYVASESRVANYRINNEALFTNPENKNDAEAVEIAKKKVRELIQGYIYFDDVSQKISDILQTVNYYIEEKGVELVYIDYLQRLGVDLYQEKKSIRRDEELGFMARDFKNIANTENHRRGKVHVRLLLQLNKDSLGRKPTEKDIAESDKIFHHLDRLECPYGKEGKKEDVLREMHLQNLKNRNGRAFWSVPFYLHGNWQRFYDETMLSDDPQAREPENTKFNFGFN